MHQNLCPYSIYSLQFYLGFSIVRIGQLIQLPTILCYLFALGSPILLLNYFVKLAINSNSIHQIITLVKHSPKSDHQHSSSITLGVILRSAILGILLSVGISFIIENNNNNQSSATAQSHFIPLGFFLVLLSFFHFSEYFVTSLTNPSTLNLSSFLIDHSIAYIVAISSSLIEFLIETYYFPGSKRFNTISLLGLLLAICGEIIRKCAMFTAGKNFTHIISSQKKSHHQLITHGIYSLFRHPSYAGWLYWAIGTQILLQNPVCSIIFAVISISFFKDRIKYEEETLIEFFGKEYEKYREKVNLWMPLC